MQVICKDGTTIQCHDFEATDSGVLLFQEPEQRSRGSEDEEEDEEAATEQRATGFVPITELRFVLPDEMVQRQAGRRGATREGGQPTGAPQGGPTPGAGQMAQQQQMQQQPGEPGRRPFDTGGQ